MDDPTPLIEQLGFEAGRLNLRASECKPLMLKAAIALRAAWDEAEALRKERDYIAAHVPGDYGQWRDRALAAEAEAAELRQRVETIAAEEREACAKVAEAWGAQDFFEVGRMARASAREISRLIRARSDIEGGV